MFRSARVCVFAVIALAISATWLAPPAAGQALYGSIIGNVKDAQGGTLPGVVLTAVNTGTGLKVEATSDETGAYAFRNLLPGTYDVTASLTGFREHQEKGIPVSAGNPARVDVTLEIGAMTETVEVVSNTTLLQTDKADISTELSSKELTSLPLNQYRNYQALINLVPGATPRSTRPAARCEPG